MIRFLGLITLVALVGCTSRPAPRVVDLPGAAPEPFTVHPVPDIPGVVTLSRPQLDSPLYIAAIRECGREARSTSAFNGVRALFVGFEDVQLHPAPQPDGGSAAGRETQLPLLVGHARLDGRPVQLAAASRYDESCRNDYVMWGTGVTAESFAIFALPAFAEYLSSVVFRAGVDRKDVGRNG